MNKAIHWLVATTVFGILLQSGGARASDPASVDAHRVIDEARASATAGDFEKAWQSYTLAIDNRAAEPELLVERALVRLEMGDPSGAALDCIVRLDKDPKDARAMGVLGLARLFEGRRELGERDLKAAADADPAVDREMHARADQFAAKREHLRELHQSRSQPVPDELVNLWKGDVKVEEGVAAEHQLLLDSRGHYEDRLFMRVEGKIETTGGVITFVTGSAQKKEWPYEILQDGSMRVGGPNGVVWTHETAINERSPLDPKLLGAWRTPIAGQYAGSRLFIIQTNGDYLLQTNAKNAGRFQAADGKWTMTFGPSRSGGVVSGAYKLSADGTKLDGLIKFATLSAATPASEATAPAMTDEQRKRMLEGAKLLFADPADKKGEQDSSGN